MTTTTQARVQLAATQAELKQATDILRHVRGVFMAQVALDSLGRVADSLKRLEEALEAEAVS
jgi:hypothetical protein